MTTFNWAEQRKRPAYLALEDGTIFRGWSVGAAVDRVGEVVFNTGLTGYQEIISDPSYAGQFVTFTCPEIGNVGMNAADRESLSIHASGLVMHACNAASNWRSESELGRALKDAGVPALAGIDTRRLTRLLRDQGTMKGFMCVTGAADEADGVAQARVWQGLDGQDYAARVSCAQPYAWDADGRETCSWGMAASLPPADLKIVAYDFGIKWNILRGLRRQGMQVTVVPAKTTAAAVLAMKPDGVLLSNGPADPAALPYAVEAIRELLGKVPMMGICLGHQLLGLALGGRTYRLKFGHHGCNHPVMDLAAGTVAITSQNHNFAVAAETLDTARVDVTHINLNDRTVEGIRCKAFPAFSVQYHPEACPGPHDAASLFQQFRTSITVSGCAAR